MFAANEKEREQRLISTNSLEWATVYYDPEITRADIDYMKAQLDTLEKELRAQPNYQRLLRDIIDRRPHITLKLPKDCKSDALDDEIAVKYDETELIGRVIHDDIRTPELTIENPTIHLYGAGRSGLEEESFAMRLGHLGFSVSEFGTKLARPVKPDDLAILFSGSWETLSTTNYAGAAKAKGAVVVGVTSYPEIAKRDCSYCIEIGGRERMGEIRDYYIDQIKDRCSTTLDLMGTVFERKVAVFADITIHHLSDTLGEMEEKMKKRHANVE